MNALAHGSRNAQSSTMNRGCRGSGWFFRIATLIIVASQGSTPAWFATSSARSCAGMCSTPVAVTRHQRSYISSNNG